MDFQKYFQSLVAYNCTLHFPTHLDFTPVPVEKLGTVRDECRSVAGYGSYPELSV